MHTAAWTTVRSFPEFLGVESDTLGTGISVAVVDSGWSARLPNDSILAGADFSGASQHADQAPSLQSTDDQIGHGTACAGLILDVAPAAKIVPIKIFSDRLECSVSRVVAALTWACDRGIRLVNLSLHTSESNQLDQLRAACDCARRSGTILVSAGLPHGQLSYPAALDSVLGVCASLELHPRGFEYRRNQAIECATGGRQPVLLLTGRRKWQWGHSFAAARMTGLAALLMQREPNLDLDGIRRILRLRVEEAHDDSV